MLLTSVDELHAAPGNPRSKLTDITELALSIRENGLIQPLVVQKVPGADGYQVIAGHRRLLAVKNLGWATVPCIVRRDMLPDQELLAMLVENGQRANLDPIEEARAYNQLIAGGIPEPEVARRVGRSVATVKARLALLARPVEEQEAIRAGHLPATRVLAKAAAERQQERLRQAGRARGRPKGVKTKPHFGDTHPLAKAALAQCSCIGKPKLGGVACGPCWEAVIRADEEAGIGAHSTGYAADHQTQGATA